MKVLLTTDTVGGVWDHTVTLARELDAAGHEVLVAVIGEPRDERLAALPTGVQVVWRAYRLEWMQDAADDVRAAGEWLRALAEVWSADVVHLNQIAYASQGFAAPVLVAVHSDVLSWWAHVHGGEAPADDWGTYASWLRAGLRAADAIVTPTAYQGTLVARYYGVKPTRVIHNGIQFDAEEPRPREGGIVLSVGRLWDRGKGVDLLDDAAALLGADAAEIHVIGETVAPHGEAFGVRSVVAHGRVERAQVDEWMRRASVYVAPSRYEPFGLAPLEAALHGCALVLSDIGTFRELWDGCGEFFPTGDAAALALAIRRVCDDPARRERLARAARTRAARRYTAHRMASEYIDLYHQMIRTHVRRPPRAEAAA
ncbi:MAG: glycosyltransferase family 4 protein [Gemmatimonadetes bacterium]|nr:glycosyltransferase family 4 protein [Gemmatimonadota bacterium]